MRITDTRDGSVRTVDFGQAAAQQAAPGAPALSPFFHSRLRCFYVMKQWYTEASSSHDRVKMAKAMVGIMNNSQKTYKIRVTPGPPGTERDGHEETLKHLRMVCVSAREDLIDHLTEVVSNTDFTTTALRQVMADTFDKWWWVVGRVFEAAPGAPPAGPGDEACVVMELGLSLSTFAKLWFKILKMEPIGHFLMEVEQYEDILIEDPIAAAFNHQVQCVIDFFQLDAYRMVPEAAPGAPDTTTTTEAAPGAPGDKCAICQDDYTVQTVKYTLPCTHEFHADCIMTWFRSGHPTCPVCRNEGDEAAPGAPDDAPEVVNLNQLSGSNFDNMTPAQISEQCRSM
jgi:hypothetical protein